MVLTVHSQVIDSHTPLSNLKRKYAALLFSVLSQETTKDIEARVEHESFLSISHGLCGISVSLTLTFLSILGSRYIRNLPFLSEIFKKCQKKMTFF